MVLSRRDQQPGWIGWGGHEYRVGKNFVGQPLGTGPTDQDGYYAVSSADHSIASLDTHARRAYLGL
jgi:hypothetical protein